MADEVISENIVKKGGYALKLISKDETVSIERGIYVVDTYRGAILDGDNDRLFNFGHIISSGRQQHDTLYGVGWNGDELFTNEKTGTVLGNDGAVGNNGFINKGTITGRVVGAGASLDGSFKRVLNSGSIVGGNIGLDATLVEGSVVRNAGTISGTASMNLTLDGGSARIENSGTLMGAVEAATTFGAKHASLAFFNKGMIHGRVILADAAIIFNATDAENYFNGRNGSVTGTITGGIKVDVIHAGDDGETINGGGGHDYLYGGLGADTFLLAASAAPDLSVNASNVHNFTTGLDHIQLSSGVLTALAAGQAPTFAVASHATSPDDHLFYDASNRYLYYDADGSGSGKAQAIGHFQPGTVLVASDFKVV